MSLAFRLLNLEALGIPEADVHTFSLLFQALTKEDFDKVERLLPAGSREAKAAKTLAAASFAGRITVIGVKQFDQPAVMGPAQAAILHTWLVLRDEGAFDE